MFLEDSQKDGCFLDDCQKDGCLKQDKDCNTTNTLLRISDYGSSSCPAPSPPCIGGWSDYTSTMSRDRQSPPSRKRKVRIKSQTATTPPRKPVVKTVKQAGDDHSCELSFPTYFMMEYTFHIENEKYRCNKDRCRCNKDTKASYQHAIPALTSREAQKGPTSIFRETTLKGPRQLTPPSLTTHITTQSPCFLDRSALAWSQPESTTSNQLPRLPTKSLSSEGPKELQEMVMLLKPRNYSAYNTMTSRDYDVTCETQLPYRDQVLKQLPTVRNCRVSWTWEDPQPRTQPRQQLFRPDHMILRPDHMTRSDILPATTRSSSASSRSGSGIIGLEFKGKLQNFLHKSSDECFKKLPCGLVYGKSLKECPRNGAARFRQNRNNNSLELCVKPV